MSINLKSKKVLAAGVAASVLAGGSAYAYWTGSGAGTGTAASAAATVALTVNQTALATAIYPGGAAQTLSGTFGNTSSGPVYVATVTASIASVTKAVGAVGACDATDYTLDAATMTVNTQVAVGNPVGAWTGATIVFNNKAGANQDGCKGATVNLGYAVA